MCSSRSVDTTTNYALYLLSLSYYNHNNRLSSAILRDSDDILSEQDRATIRSALSCDTTTDYLLCFSVPSLIVDSLKLHVLY